AILNTERPAATCARSFQFETWPRAVGPRHEALYFASRGNQHGRLKEYLAYSVRSQRDIGRMTTGAKKPILKPLIKLLPQRPAAPKRPTVARQITIEYEAVDAEAGSSRVCRSNARS